MNSNNRPQPIVSVAGLRGIVGESFTPEILTPYVAAFADMLERPLAVVGGDSRPSRNEWAQAHIVATLRGRGVDVIEIGLVPTPTLGMMVREFGAGGGIAITASHNPIEWNGLKFFHAAGEFLTPEHHERLHALMERPEEEKGARPTGRLEERRDAVAIHLAKVIAAAGKAPPDRKPLRVVLDCCNGAASELGPLLGKALGTEAVILFNDPEAGFPRVAEPLPEHLGALCAAVREHGADFGAAFDPDADRLALVDETGRAIGEERTLVLAADTFFSAEMPGDKLTPIVVNLSTSRAIEAVADKYGRAVGRTRIGEAHVLAGMRAQGAAIGGEGNGGVIVPAVHPGRDGAMALALVVRGLQRRGGTLSEWNAAFPDFAMAKEKLPCGGRPFDEALAAARAAFADAADFDTTDGLKAIYADRWVHLRPSGTEPILRIFAEAPDEAAAGELAARARAALS